jgi:hypothetical protein
VLGDGNPHNKKKATKHKKPVEIHLKYNKTPKKQLKRWRRAMEP